MLTWAADGRILNVSMLVRFSRDFHQASKYPSIFTYIPQASPWQGLSKMSASSGRFGPDDDECESRSCFDAKTWVHKFGKNKVCFMYLVGIKIVIVKRYLYGKSTNRF